MKFYRILQGKTLFLKFGVSIGLLLRKSFERPLSKHFFQRTTQHGGWKSPQSNDKLLKN